MKLIKLTMNAFSAYHQHTTIDFENMIDHGLYLISGPTGAGKTTIFDAITFALYGSASGSERNQAHFRSDYADVKEETYVELTFEIHQKIYTIKRSPTYTRPGFKTAKMATASLTCDHQTIEGIKEVKQKVNQLLGVDVYQFKQIVMIAQGEFTKLIYADSEEREKVLRHIFHTESLVQFEEALKDKTREYKEEYMLSSQYLSSQYQHLSFSQEFMDQHKDGFHPIYIDEACIENQKQKQSYEDFQKQYHLLKNTYDQMSQEYYQKQKQNQNILEYKQIAREYDKHLQQKETIERCHADIQKLKILQTNQTMIYHYHTVCKERKNLLEELKQVTKQKEQEQKHFHQVDMQYQQLDALKKQKDQLMLAIHHFNQVLEQQKQYHQIEKQYQKIKTLYHQKKQTYDELLKVHEQLNKRMERDHENVNQLPELQLQLEKIDQLVKETNQRRLSIHDLSELYDQYKDKQDKHYELARHYQKKEQDYQAIFQKYHLEDENFKKQQAGILALELQDGQPCPVCGSPHHPHLAKLSTHVLSSRELEDLAQQVEKAKDMKEDVYQEVLLQNEAIQSVKSKIDVYKQQLNIQDELSKEVFIRLLSTITQMTTKQKKNYQKQYTEVEYLKKIKNSLKQDQVVFDKQTSQLERSLLEIHELENRIIELKTQMESLNQNDEIKDCKQQLENKQESLRVLEKKIQDIDQQYHQVQERLSLLQQRVSSLQTSYQNTNVQYEDAKNDYEILIKKHFQDAEEYKKYQSMFSQLNEMEKQYQEYYIQERSLLSQLKKLDEYKDLEVVDLSIVEEKLKVTEKQKDSLFQMMNESQIIYQQNQKLIKKIQTIYSQNQDIFQKYTMYQDLYDYASGKNAQRMSFERYVLSSYFEHILEYANIELMKMSQGRFALYRKQETKGAKQQGLDLSVLDYETGVMRDIQSLSGGESFKAALSLALGLSSMIQSYAGGIELNTLFIDEGFGSLDSESLDQALAVLMDLKNDNKVIGIISHVGELKERISTQIVVEKSHDGSVLHIEKD